MGNVANVVLVRSEDAEQVATCFERYLADSAAGGTSANPYAENDDGPLRALITQPTTGWVGVLPSVIYSAHAVAQHLSTQLKMPVLFAAVHDSDEWMYELFNGNRLVSTFGSADGSISDDKSELPGTNDGSLDSQQSFESKMKEFDDLLPEDLKGIPAKALQGTATTDENQRFVLWYKRNGKRVEEKLYGKDATAGPDQEQPEKAEAYARKHAVTLRDTIGSVVDEAAVIKLMLSSSVFAEEQLGSFFELIGAPVFYAHLSYDYWHEVMGQEAQIKKIAMHREVG